MNNIIHVNSIIQNINNDILLVIEGKNNAAYGKLNFPGGHLDPNESIPNGAIREAKEETGLDINLISLIGIYVGYGQNIRFINFIFFGKTSELITKPQNDEILECKWFSLESIPSLHPDTILNPDKFNKIIRDFCSGIRIPINAINDNGYGK